MAYGEEELQIHTLLTSAEGGKQQLHLGGIRSR